MNKKIFTAFIALLLGVSASFAQEVEYKHVPHWFMQVQAGIAHTRGEAKFKELLSPAAAINAGYSFNKSLALRFGVSGWQGKGGWVVNPDANYKYNYLQLGADAMLDFTNLFGEFNPKRVVSFYGFLGVGYNCSFNNDEAVALAAQGATMRLLWDGAKHFVVGRGGLGLNFRLTDKLGLNIEANANTLSDKFNSKKAGNTDWQFNGLVGLTIKFGKGYEKIEKAPAQPIKSEPVEQPAVQVVEPIAQPVQQVKVEPMVKHIFYTIDYSKVSEAEMSKIDEIVEYLNKYPQAKVTVTGYADKGTGYPKYNMQLSERRANSVAAILIEKGIASDRVIAVAKGDTEQPFEKVEDNRVSICVAE